VKCKLLFEAGKGLRSSRSPSDHLIYQMHTHYNTGDIIDFVGAFTRQLIFTLYDRQVSERRHAKRFGWKTARFKFITCCAAKGTISRLKLSSSSTNSGAFNGSLRTNYESLRECCRFHSQQPILSELADASGSVFKSTYHLCNHWNCSGQ
jgi:hypothetical protein